MIGAQASLLPDGRRLHLHHGPIDLIIEAFGPDEERLCAYRQAADRFKDVLTELVADLPRLRAPVSAEATPALTSFGSSAIARRMCEVAEAHQPAFVTPMAAVAGAVADHILAVLLRDRELERAYVNNGGDVALWLASGKRMTIAAGPALSDQVTITAETPVRGVATSGWRGRSHSLGIADAVTVLARTAAEADVAATLIANAVDLPDHPEITRRRADMLDPDSDLGSRPVTTAVGALSHVDTCRALGRGAKLAQTMLAVGLIHTASLWLNGEVMTVSKSCATDQGIGVGCDPVVMA